MGKREDVFNLSDAAKKIGGCKTRTEQRDFIDFLVLNGVMEKVVMNHKKIGKTNYYGLNTKHTLYFILLEHTQEIFCEERGTGKRYPQHVYIDTYLAKVLTRLYRVSKIKGTRHFNQDMLKEMLLDVALEYVPKID